MMIPRRMITNERYVYISSSVGVRRTKNKTKKLTTSDKIDRVVTNRWLALPIFAEAHAAGSRCICNYRRRLGN